MDSPVVVDFQIGQIQVFEPATGQWILFMLLGLAKMERCVGRMVNSGPRTTKFQGDKVKLGISSPQFLIIPLTFKYCLFVLPFMSATTLKHTVAKTEKDIDPQR